MKLQLSYPLDLPFNISQRFGGNGDFYKQYGLVGHNGFDLSVPNGTPVCASHDGEVTYTGLDGANGVLVVLKTLEQFDYKDGQAYFKTLYGHLKEGSIVVTVGQKVKRGEKLAESNNTGASTGPHVHWGLKPIMQGEQDWQWFNYEQDNGYNGAIDPSSYLTGETPKDVNKTQPEAISALPQPFLDMQKAILAFQLSEGLLDFKFKPLEDVRFGDKTKFKANRYLIKDKYKL